jgi:hypothetical protein
MTKREAAKILAAAVPVYARRWGVARIDKDLYWAVISELRATAEPGTYLHQAALVMPAYRTVKAAATGRLTR